MASRRKLQQEDARLRVLQILGSDSQITSREIAQKVGISNGTAYYLLISLIEKGFVKYENYKKSSQKMQYIYLLTPKGIREKSLLTQRFIVRKKIEYEALREEIAQLEQNAGISSDFHKNDD